MRQFPSTRPVEAVRRQLCSLVSQWRLAYLRDSSHSTDDPSRSGALMVPTSEVFVPRLDRDAHRRGHGPKWSWMLQMCLSGMCDFLSRTCPLCRLPRSRAAMTLRTLPQNFARPGVYQKVLWVIS